MNDLIWAAGFMDSQSSINIVQVTNASGNVGHHPRCQLDREWKSDVEIFEKILGCGKIYQKTDTRSGKNTYTWNARVDEIEFVMELLLPYLKIKNRHAEIMLAFYKVKRAKGCQESTLEDTEKRIALYQEIQSLNKRGSNVGT